MSVRRRFGEGLQSFASTVMDARKNNEDDDDLQIEALIQGSVPSNILRDFDPTKLRELGSGLYPGNDMNSLISKIFRK